jgi:hypothetical protein
MLRAVSHSRQPGHSPQPPTRVSQAKSFRFHSTLHWNSNNRSPLPTTSATIDRLSAQLLVRSPFLSLLIELQLISIDRSQCAPGKMPLKPAA